MRGICGILSALRRSTANCRIRTLRPFSFCKIFVFTSQVRNWRHLHKRQQHLTLIEVRDISTNVFSCILQERQRSDEVLLLLPIWVGNAISNGRANGSFRPLFHRKCQASDGRILLFPFDPWSSVLLLHAHLDFIMLQYVDVRRDDLQFMED